MCGIAGWFSISPRMQNGAEQLQSMAAALKHRGPDGINQLEIAHAGMMHARLAMVDLAGGDQPMWSTDRRAVIVFNGEIFNYKPLRSHYEAQGVVFHTQSDTEVILAAYQVDGESGFGRLRGMFAFALWDVVAQRALLVRDALGIKPLFVAENAQGALYFSSEAKAIHGLNRQHHPLDVAALHLLLNFRYIPGERSLFKGIRQLAPGVCLEWYVDGKTNSRLLQGAPETSGETLGEVLVDSVRAHLVADVPVGSYLSGGIDSGLVTAMARADTVDLSTFTLAVGDDPAEARNAAETARILGVRNTQAALGDDEVLRLPHMLWHLETPKVNAVQLFRLAELARTQVKAALSGVGGDELFAGYNVHRIFQLYARVPATASRLVGGALKSLLPAAAIPFAERERAFDMAAMAGDWPRVYALLRNIWEQPALRSWLYGPRMLDADLPDAIGVVRERWATQEKPLAAMMDFEWRNKMVNDLLWQEDRASMASGLEVRAPFVDLAVKRFVSRMGPQRPGKAALRDVAQHYLPDNVLRRPKSGFQLDAPVFFDTHLRPLSQIWLSPERVRHYGLFNAATVVQLLRLPVERRYRWHYFMLYLMIQSHMWIDIFESGHSPGDIAYA